MDIFRTGFGGTYRQMLDAEESKSESGGIQSDGIMEQASHAALSDYIIVGSASSVKCFDKNGNQLWHVPVSLKNPMSKPRAMTFWLRISGEGISAL